MGDKLRAKIKARYDEIQAEFLECLRSHSRFSLASPLKAKAKEFRKKLLLLGSETPDNIRATENLDIDFVEFNKAVFEIGLVTAKSRYLISDVLHRCEGIPIPKKIKKSFPELTQDEWDACFRVVTLAFTGFYTSGVRDTPKKSKKKRKPEG